MRPTNDNTHETDPDEDWYAHVDAVLAHHSDELDRLSATPAKAKSAGSRPATNWRRLKESVTSSELAALSTWVHWFVERYMLRSLVPPCWALHASMIEELSALAAAWRGAYENQDATADAGLGWHEHLEMWRARWPNYNLDNCNINVHRATVDVDWPDVDCPNDHPSPCGDTRR